jgi:hypothetical protein
MKQNIVTVFLAVAEDGRVIVNMAQGEKIEERLAELSRLHKRPLDWQYQIRLRPIEAQGVIDAFSKHFEPQRTGEWFEVGAIEAIQALDEWASRAINYRPEESRTHPAELVKKLLGSSFVADINWWLAH